MIDPQPGDRVRMTLIGTFGYDRHDRSPILTVRNDATGAIYEVPVHVEAAFTPAEASAAALAEEIRDANIGWDEMQNSVTAETWPGTWDEWVADALIEAGYIAKPAVRPAFAAALAGLVEASLEPCDYTQEPQDGPTEYEPLDHERARANIMEMHRLLVLRCERLMDSDEELRAAEAERDLALWLHAEAVWKREEAHRHWRNMDAYISQRIAKPGEPIVVAADRVAAELAALRTEVERLTGEVAERTRERDDALRRHHNLAYLTAPDVFAAAQQQDTVRLPADARGEIERLLTANVGKPAGGVAHKLMLLLTSDSWRASRAPTEDPADTCDCAGEQCAGPRETCAAFPTEPESLKAQYSVRSLDYIRELYRVPAEVNRRVIFDGDPGKITGALGPYLLVLLDGDDEPVPVHPTWHMSYPATEDEGGEH